MFCTTVLHEAMEKEKGKKKYSTKPEPVEHLLLWKQYVYYLIKDHIFDIFCPVLSGRREEENFQALRDCDKNLKTKDQFFSTTMYAFYQVN